MPISEVYNMDCMEYMKGIPDKFFDLAIVDPQYGIDIMHKGGMPKHLGFKQYKRKDWDKKPQEKVFYARNTLKYCEMKLNKKTERLIKRRAAELKKLYETPNPEVDKIISELRAEATKRPQNMSKEEEIAYILKKADENCDHIEIRKILNESNT